MLNRHFERRFYMLTKEAFLWNLIYQSYSESFDKEELSQLEFIAKETGRTKSEVLKDLIKRESHLLYYGYYSR